ncbi:uncharacterized protein LOC129291806 [Prosopis cineraria]|uniref:uncharacterized protein LOC129291806 n=1 Tax=Prosopis cineraria TaxID=364024 RepID=UPI00240EAA07|nr:uncharacterized protein LOC129291806 [Prosopis cineraria]
MGSVASFMGGKVSLTQGKSILYHPLYDKFIGDVKIENFSFDDFHIAFLQIINTVNAVVPGRHYEYVPNREEIEKLYHQWKEETVPPAKKKKMVEDFIVKNVKMKSADKLVMLAGLAAPPAAMAAKRAGESLPQLKIMKVVPDLLFVPSATLLALMGCKLSTTLKQIS